MRSQNYIRNRVSSLFSATLLFALFVSVNTFDAYAQAVPEEESFDNVTAPALPSGWSSTRPGNLGAQNAVTSTVQKNSAPNAAFLPNPGSVSATALVTKTYQITTNLPTTSIDVDFMHKRGMETNFDGGVLEVSLNGGAFVDVTSPSIGGTFSSGAYNLASVPGGFSNPLAGRKAWTGTSASFESVSLNLPSIPDNSTLTFRFVIGTDNLVSAAGWFIDDFTLEASTDMSLTLTTLTPEIAPGGTATLNAGYVNPTSFKDNVGVSYVSAPSGKMKSVTLSLSGAVQRLGKWIEYLIASEPLDPFSTMEVAISVTDIPGRAGARGVYTLAITPPLVGISAAFAFLSSSPNIPGGVLTKKIDFLPFDPCLPPPGVLPYSITDKVVVIPASPACGYGVAALAAQNLGAVAAIIAAPPAVDYPPFDYPAPFVTEPTTPGLSIPVLVFDPTSSPYFYSGLGAPGVAEIRLEGNNSAELRTLPVSVQQLAGDPVLGNNSAAEIVRVVTDVDSDGTPDVRDGCKFDNKKAAPGVCGCGVVDQDLNSNGVMDCLTSSDYKAQATKLLSLVKKLKLTSKNYKDTAKQIKSVSASLKGFNSASISALGGASISSLSNSANKSVKAVLKAKTSSTLSTASQDAVKSLKKLIGAIAA